MTITKKSLDLQAADWLLEAIVEGKFVPGISITETEVATETGLSRSTIRTALQRLSADGLVVQKPYTGWEITPLSMEDAHELYSLRHNLETMAVRLAAENIDDAGRRALQGALKHLKTALRSGKRRTIAEADLAVHQKIAEISKHRRLASLCESLNKAVLIYIVSTSSVKSDLDMIHQHEEIINAIVSGDPELSVRLIEEHIRDAERTLIDFFTQSEQRITAHQAR